MLKGIIAILLLSNILKGYGQSTNVDSVLRPYNKYYSKSVKFFRPADDISAGVIGYNKKSHEVLTVIKIFSENSNLPLGEYYWFYFPDSIIYIRALPISSNRRRRSKAEYVFKSKNLVAKKEENATRDFSILYTYSDSLKKMAASYVARKFSKR